MMVQLLSELKFEIFRLLVPIRPFMAQFRGLNIVLGRLDYHYLICCEILPQNVRLIFLQAQKNTLFLGFKTTVNQFSVNFFD